MRGELNKTQGSETAYFDSETRTRAAKLHISLTFIYRALALALGFLLVPLTINYLDIEQYGIWMTLLSVMSWVAFFDIGLGNGMRNKLAEALAVNDIDLARIYVSTTYAVISLIALMIFVVFVVIVPLIPWNKVFNTATISNTELSIVVFTVGSLLLFGFVLSLCNQLFYAYQRASLPALQQLLLNLFALVVVYLIVQYTTGELLYLAIGYGLSVVLSKLLLTYYFLRKHGEAIPSLGYVDLRRMKEIASLGIKFFVIQIAVLIIFATDNIIITQVLGPEYVTPYVVIFKLFSVIMMGHTVLLTPLWSAYTEAYTKGDIRWIKSTLKKLNLLMIPIILSVSVLVLFARDIVDIWIGPEIEFPFLLVVLMGVYVIIAVWNNIYAYFVNGIGRIKPQMYSAILGGLINIPLSVYFAKYLDMGISGVILGTIISLSLFAVIGPIQTYFILKMSKVQESRDE